MVRRIGECFRATITPSHPIHTPSQSELFAADLLVRRRPCLSVCLSVHSFAHSPHSITISTGQCLISIRKWMDGQHTQHTSSVVLWCVLWCVLGVGQSHLGCLRKTTTVASRPPMLTACRPQMCHTPAPVSCWTLSTMISPARESRTAGAWSLSSRAISCKVRLRRERFIRHTLLNGMSVTIASTLSSWMPSSCPASPTRASTVPFMRLFLVAWRTLSCALSTTGSSVSTAMPRTG
mmetsp:Transcript_30675/g.89202  ORF Transcript_30675/g.89202 Transcript_30675/m.89202 type:complete len:236 (-) Transcript_30675:1188-1895(-)